MQSEYLLSTCCVLGLTLWLGDCLGSIWEDLGQEGLPRGPATHRGALSVAPQPGAYTPPSPRSRLPWPLPPSSLKGTALLPSPHPMSSAVPLPLAPLE